MAGGSVTLTVDSYDQLVQVAQTVTCWAAADKGKIRMDTQGRVPAVVIPEAVIAGKGALILRRGGTDLVSGYVAGTNPVFAVANLLSAIGLNPGTCPVRTSQPNGVVSITTPPWGITLTVDNQALGTVLVNWGDGTSTAGVAQNGTPTKTYAPYPGTRTITITDESDPTAPPATIAVYLPYNV